MKKIQIPEFFVCVSVCLCVCLCVPAKKCNNFSLRQDIGMKFSGSPKLLASNFLVGDLDPEALGVSPEP